MTLAWDQNSPSLAVVAKALKNSINEKNSAVKLKTPAMGVDVVNGEYDILLGMQPYYTTRSLPSIQGFLITDRNFGRDRFPFGEDKLGKCGQFMCNTYSQMAFNGFTGSADEMEQMMSVYAECTGQQRMPSERTFYLERCEEYYQQSKTPVFILDYYVPYQFSIGPDCR